MSSEDAGSQFEKLQADMRQEAVAELDAWSAAAGGGAEKAAETLTDEEVNGLVHEAR